MFRAPEVPENLYRLNHSSDALSERHSDGLQFMSGWRIVEARAESKHEPAGRDSIDGCGGMSQEQRMPQCRQQHPRTKRHFGRARGNRAQQRKRFVSWTCQKRISYPQRIETRRLGGLAESEEFRRFGGSKLLCNARGQEEADPYPRSLLADHSVIIIPNATMSRAANAVEV